MSTITYANVNTNVNADTNADTNADENINVDNFTLLSVLRSRLTGQNTHLHCTGTFLNPTARACEEAFKRSLDTAAVETSMAGCRHSGIYDRNAKAPPHPGSAYPRGRFKARHAPSA
jgi:hypothetical protein